MAYQNLVGQKLGQYQLIELLGAGTMGAVYRAQQLSLRREVAVKVVSEAFSTQPDYADRFTQEARTIATLEHPHIVPVHDYGTIGGVSYIAMRLLKGGSLANRLIYSQRIQQPLPSLSETAQILNQLAGALDYAHSQGVIHRDIKASNVMFDERGNAFVVDFGIAKLAHATTGMTSTGVALGTPSYMAPEQWRTEPVTPAADQYATAVLVYQTLTGRMPFEADTVYAYMNLHLNEPPTPPTTYLPDFRPDVEAVLLRALAKQPADRYPNLTAFAQAFEAAARASEPTPVVTGFLTLQLPERAAAPQPQETRKLEPETTGAVSAGTRPPAPTELLPVENVVGEDRRRRWPLALLLVALFGLAACAALLLLPALLNDPNMIASQTANAATAQAVALAGTLDAAQTQTAAAWTATSSPTSTPTASRTRTPTRTRTRTATPPRMTITPRTNANLRTGPGTEYPVVGQANAGQTYPVIARYDDGDDRWYLIEVDPDRPPRWISEDVVDASGDGDSVPTASSIPPTPARTSSPVVGNTPGSTSGGGATGGSTGGSSGGSSSGGAATGGISTPIPTTDPCPAPGTICSAVCVDTTSDEANCGACGVTCGNNEACTNSVCDCAPNYCRNSLTGACVPRGLLSGCLGG